MNDNTTAEAGSGIAVSTQQPDPRPGYLPSQDSKSGVVAARIFLGFIVLLCAEMFSGASVPAGLWNPFVWLLTYWLYFAHFFFFTTLAVRTGRTSLASLYLWGVLYGLYEGWITKVIWAGYPGVGDFVLGGIGHFGFSEISMVFLFHPVMSFILPLAVACVLYPSLRSTFPDLAWLTGKSKLARFVQVYLVLSFAPIMAINSGGTLNLAANMAFAIALLYLLSRWARNRSTTDGRTIVVFGRRGFRGLCLYLAVLYGVTYPYLNPEGLPSSSVQLVTVGFYLLALMGLGFHQRRDPLPSDAVKVEPRELRLIKTLFGIVLLLALPLSLLVGNPVLFIPIVLNFMIWTLLGFILTGLALWFGLWSRTRSSMFLRTIGTGGAVAGVLLCVLIGTPLILLAGTVPKTYPTVENPIEPPDPATQLGGGLDGFESPYVGHTGSWDGKGGGMFGSSKLGDLDKEVGMGLRWTFMCAYWRALEPDGPVDLSNAVPAAWAQLDAFVIAAHDRNLNILMQAPVVGGNAGGPPKWAGRREPGKSAPANMDALAEFAGKLAQRYRPGGTLATDQGWAADYGVRAWELDNEPESYRTNWKGQAADYAEFVTKASAAIKNADPLAVILAPGMACGDHHVEWLESALDAQGMGGSKTFREQAEPYSIGPATDVVSFHIYEGLDTFFSGGDQTVGRAFQRVRDTFEKWETRSPGFEYARKKEYWHTEGNFDFLGLMSEKRRAAWRLHFFTRAFAAGIRKVVVMDASRLEQTAVRTYVDALPDPFPMLPADAELHVIEGKATAFRHPEGPAPDGGQVWVVWALADSGDAVAEFPVRRAEVEVLTVDGQSKTVQATDGRIRLELKGDRKMPPPLLVVDRPAP